MAPFKVPANISSFPAGSKPVSEIDKNGTASVSWIAPFLAPTNAVTPSAGSHVAVVRTCNLSSVAAGLLTCCKPTLPIAGLCAAASWAQIGRINEKALCKTRLEVWQRRKSFPAHVLIIPLCEPNRPSTWLSKVVTRVRGIVTFSASQAGFAAICVRPPTPITVRHVEPGAASAPPAKSIELMSALPTTVLAGRRQPFATVPCRRRASPPPNQLSQPPTRYGHLQTSWPFLSTS